MDKLVVEVSRYFNYAPGRSVFMCLVSDDKNLSPIKIKIKRNSDFIANLNPETCKANFFMRNRHGVTYYHHLNVDFLTRKSWLEFNLKQFIEKIGLKYSNIVLGPRFPDSINLPYYNNWLRYPTDTEYGICVTDTAPPCMKHVYLERNALILCGKSVAKIELWGRTYTQKNLPQVLVSKSHIWTANDIDSIIQVIPKNGLSKFKVYFYDCNVAYGFIVAENRVNIIIYPDGSPQFPEPNKSEPSYIGDEYEKAYTHLTPVLSEDELIKIGFKILFSCISAKDLDGIKAKISKYKLMGY